MTEPIQDIVDVQINLQSVPLTGEAFGTLLIMANSSESPSGGWGGDVIRFYNSFSAVAADFASNTEAYKAAQAYFAQSPTPTQVAIGKRVGTVQQTDQVTVVNAVNAEKYSITINGVTFTHTATNVDTDATIAAALNTLINANPAIVALVDSTVDGLGHVNLQAHYVGASYTASVTSDTPGDITIAHTAAAHGLADDIQAIIAAGHSSDWYGVMPVYDASTSSQIADILSGAPFVEALNPKHVIFFESSDPDTLTGTGVGTNFLFASEFDRSPWIYTGSPNQYPNASMAAIYSASQPGTITANLKTLPGITPDNLTPSNITAIQSKNGNYYTQFLGNGTFNAAIDGRCPSAQWIDNVVGCDYIANSMTVDILTYLRSQAKVPYTDAGISAVANIVMRWLNTGVNILLFTNDPRPTITQTPTSQVSASLKAQRLVDTTVLTFEAFLANAINRVKITGNVSF